MIFFYNTEKNWRISVDSSVFSEEKYMYDKTFSGF